jgi:hypothetical protein
MNRNEIYNMFNGRCAYSGTPLKEDWQIDHIIPKNIGGSNNIDNLLPVQKILNHYKRSLSLEDFRIKWLGGLHIRLAKLPKNPRTEQSKKRIQYLQEIAKLFNITPDKPFSKVFYFEYMEKERNNA